MSGHYSEQRPPAVTAAVIVIVLLVSMSGVAGGIAGSISGGNIGDVGDGAGDGVVSHNGQLGSTAPVTDIGPAIADSEGKQTVIVRLAERPANERRVTAADQHVGALRSHAVETQSAFEKFAAGNPHVEITHRFWLTNAMVVTVDTDVIPIGKLGTVDNVEGVHENFEIEQHRVAGPTPASLGGFGGPQHPGTQTVESNVVTVGNESYTYGLAAIGVPAAWDGFENRGEGVRVAVLDTGIDVSHPDLSVSDDTGWAEFDAHGNQVDSDPYDSQYHGSHVSGTVAGANTTGTSIGVAPNIELMHGLVLPGRSGTFAQVIAGMEWAVGNDADIISMSLGGPNRSVQFIDPVQHAEQAGVFVVSSSGNNGEGTSSSPGDVYEALSVGASDRHDEIADFSSGDIVTTSEWDAETGTEDWPESYTVPDIVAPGVSIASAVPDGNYAALDGTSMAAPHVSGAAALVLSNADEPLTPKALRERFESTAVDVGEEPHRQGAGRIDVFEALYTHSKETLDPIITTTTANISVAEPITVAVNHPIEQYHWTFEDGTTQITTEPTVTHSFEQFGTSTVTVTLEDIRGHNVTTSAEIEVIDSIPPVAQLTAETQSVEVYTEPAVFNASGSTDNDAIAAYNWSFGDGTTNTTTDAVVTHSYESVGTYTPSVTVSDKSGNENTTVTEIDVIDTAPPTLSISEVRGGVTDGETRHVNKSDEIVVSITADNGQATPGAVSTVRAVAESVASNARYPLSVDAVDNESFNWTATLDPETLVDEGHYILSVTAVDESDNTNTTGLSEFIRYDRTAPQLSLRVTDSTETTATARIRSNEPLDETPLFEVTNTTDVTTPVAALTARPATEWEATFETDEAGVYQLSASASDRAGNHGTDTASVLLQPAVTTTNRTVTVVNDQTGGFIQFNTTTEVAESSVAMSATAREPYPLAPEMLGSQFITTTLGDSLAGTLSNATIGIPVDMGTLPAGTDPSDDRISLSWYNETSGQWESNELTYRPALDRPADQLSGEYWVGTVEHFSTYGVMIEDDEPPTLVSVTPSAGTSLSSNTETVDIELEYDDNGAGVNASTISVEIAGVDYTDDSRTQITSKQTAVDGFAVTAGSTYEIRLSVTDNANNTAVFTPSFSVEADETDENESDDGSDDDGTGDGSDEGGADNGGDAPGSDDREEAPESDTEDGSDGDQPTNDSDVEPPGEDEGSAEEETEEPPRTEDDGAEPAGDDTGTDGDRAQESTTIDTDSEGETRAGETATAVEDETPGFGLLVSLSALLGVSLLLRRIHPW